MNAETRQRIQSYVSDNIDAFHRNRIEKLQRLRLNDVLKRKNPYLFKAKNLNLAHDLITAILDATLSSSEEGLFGGFLEELAIYVAENTGGGQKSAAEGLDIELVRENTRYLIAVKSGKNWGNASQHHALERNFQAAVRVLQQSRQVGALQPTLGICYGSFRTCQTGAYLHIGGQSFWHLISGDPNLYIDLIEPLGYQAEQHNQRFEEEKGHTYNRFIRDFTQAYCSEAGAIDWPRLVRFVSGNLP